MIGIVCLYLFVGNGGNCVFMIMFLLNDNFVLFMFLSMFLLLLLVMVEVMVSIGYFVW